MAMPQYIRDDLKNISNGTHTFMLKMNIAIRPRTSTVLGIESLTHEYICKGEVDVIRTGSKFIFKLFTAVGTPYEFEGVLHPDAFLLIGCIDDRHITTIVLLPYD